MGGQSHETLKKKAQFHTKRSSFDNSIKIKIIVKFQKSRYIFFKHKNSLKYKNWIQKLKIQAFIINYITLHQNLSWENILLDIWAKFSSFLSNEFYIYHFWDLKKIIHQLEWYQIIFEFPLNIEDDKFEYKIVLYCHVVPWVCAPPGALGNIFYNFRYHKNFNKTYDHSLLHQKPSFIQLLNPLII